MPIMSSTRAFRLAAQSALKAATFPLNAATLFLFTNTPAINENTLMEQLTLATFAGSDPVAGVVFGSPFVDAFGRYMIAAPSEAFIATDALVSENVTGWGLANAGLDNLGFAVLLDTPVPVEKAGDGLIVDPVYPWSA